MPMQKRPEDMELVELYLSLGSNQGDRRLNIEHAVSMLNIELKRPYKAVSSIIETEPWGFESSNNFLNCCAAFETDLTPLQVLDTTERIERELGRTIKSTDGNYHDRIIDIDILLYGNETVETPRLTIPHPLMHKREFVLHPLAEIAHDAIHPTTGKSIKTLLEEFKEL